MNAQQPINIFNVNKQSFEKAAFETYRLQLEYNEVYQEYHSLLPAKFQHPEGLTAIPFLPINLFKTKRVVAFEGKEEVIFSSSGTTGMATSKHFVKSLGLYESSFLAAFREFYGSPSQFAFLCLLPSYMEREGSSLIYMAERLVKESGNPESGFFLHAGKELQEVLLKREMEGKPSFLLGVTFSLLDFADVFPMQLRHTIVMETGGMKGRKKEITRSEVHEHLTSAFGLSSVDSEYGMTELLSQAYSKGNGIFRAPPWMKILVRDEDDPFTMRESGTGLLCIIDLANLYSCSFIETSDLGRVYEDGSFEVLGRIDNSDIRGCSLLMA
jgi:hypothetical protein